MGSLTTSEISLILSRLSTEEVAKFDGYTVTKPGFGYSKDREIGALQAKLSIMLEIAGKRERGGV